VRSGRVAVVVVVRVVAEAAHTVDMRRDRNIAVAVELEAEVVEGAVLRPEVAVVAASSGQLEATVPMQPNLPAAVVLLAELEAAPEQEPEHRTWVLRMMLPQEAVAVVHMQPPVGVSSSTAGANLQRCCWHTSWHSTEQ
jgi:hypothetical protein